MRRGRWASWRRSAQPRPRELQSVEHGEEEGAGGEEEHGAGVDLRVDQQCIDDDSRATTTRLSVFPKSPTENPKSSLSPALPAFRDACAAHSSNSNSRRVRISVVANLI